MPIGQKKFLTFISYLQYQRLPFYGKGNPLLGALKLTVPSPLSTHLPPMHLVERDLYVLLEAVLGDQALALVAPWTEIKLGELNTGIHISFARIAFSN